VLRSARVNPPKIARTFLLVSLVAHTAAAQQPTTTRIDLSKVGPQVGQRVPDFSLKDQRGNTWTRQSILGPKGGVLVFFRSADW